MTHNLQAIILAAGKSSRFKTGKTKLIEKICGQEMILYPIRLLEQLAIPTTLVVGFQQDLIKQLLAHHSFAIPLSFITQETQAGTGHALLCTEKNWNKDNILIMNGDVPLVTPEIMHELITKHQQSNAVISFVISHNADPSLQGYGRIVEQNGIIEIVEAKNFTGDPHKECCINAGIYIIKKDFLVNAITQLAKNDVSQEFYITDLIKIASSQNPKVTTVTVPFDRIRGINTLQELWIAEQIKRADLIKYWMEQGVYFSVAQNVHIDLNVKIGAGSKIGSGVHLLGTTIIGSDCEVQEFSSLENTIVGDNSRIFPHCIIKDSIIGSETKIGPFAHLHTQSSIGNKSIIGNFVEVKKTAIGDTTRAKHLAYLGDAHIGNHVNIGAGTIICNHNGVTKNNTSIHDNAYIGSNNTLIAPLTIGKGAFTAAGSVITESVPSQALAIGRARQVIKEEYAQKIKEKNSNTNSVQQCVTPATDIPSF